MIDPAGYDAWVTTDREGERAQAAFEQYARAFDTAENRAALARTMADDACSSLDAAPMPTEAFNHLKAAVLLWIERYGSEAVLPWMASAHVIGADFETWYARKGDD